VTLRGIEVDKKNIEVIEKLKFPTNIKGVKSFQGHYGFYRRFIKNFSQIAKLLTNLLVKNLEFIFMEECAKTFNELKITLI
jgi:PII-like signaling protein